MNKIAAILNNYTCAVTWMRPEISDAVPAQWLLQRFSVHHLCILCICRLDHTPCGLIPCLSVQSSQCLYRLLACTQLAIEFAKAVACYFQFGAVQRQKKCSQGILPMQFRIDVKVRRRFSQKTIRPKAA